MFVVSSRRSGVTYKERRGVLGLDTGFIWHSPLIIISYNLRSNSISHSLHVTVHAPSLLISPLVPASNGESSSLYVAELSTRHSHSDFWLKCSIFWNCFLFSWSIPSGTFPITDSCSRSRNRSYFTTDGQSVRHTDWLTDGFTFYKLLRIS
jgi:hypothetical protein